jgi:hypothetical protein
LGENALAGFSAAPAACPIGFRPETKQFAPGEANEGSEKKPAKHYLWTILLAVALSQAATPTRIEISYGQNHGIFLPQYCRPLGPTA